ncbi:aspartate/glutamate racemase family protein [Candidatus Poriferisodalis sp.]|uniref:aspartate/glutamate racemase family protein n=1 Tax=Candidatus Poriferisodalis sp. TaxID=3101277 RepID=UPI003C6F2A16
MARILWINPVGTDAYDAPIGAELRREASATTRVDVCSLPGAGPQHLEWNALEAVVAGPTMGVVRWAAEQRGYDAAVVGCFYDPFLRGARELAGPMAVTAPAEACLHIAATVGERVAILVGRRKWIPEMRENVVKYGYGDHLAAFRVLEMGVDEFQADAEATQQRILDEAERAVHVDGADSVVLGCTIEFGFYREVQEKIGVPVIDAITAPLRYAEFLAALGADHGWRTSRVGGYESVPARELEWIPMVEPVLDFDPRP